MTVISGHVATAGSSVDARANSRCSSSVMLLTRVVVVLVNDVNLTPCTFILPMMRQRSCINSLKSPVARHDRALSGAARPAHLRQWTRVIVSSTAAVSYACAIEAQSLAASTAVVSDSSVVTQSPVES